MATIARFSRNMRSRASQIRNAPVRVQQEAASATLYALASDTPVDKGVARSNWRVSLGQRTFSVIPAHAPGSKLGKHETQNLAITMQLGLSKIAQLKPNTALYITNNAPHIEKLNDGHSAQSQKGFIDRAMLVARHSVQGFKVFTR